MTMNRFEPLGLGVGTLLSNRYDIVQKLGSGGMSAVYLVVDRAVNNDPIALKLFDPRLMNEPTQLDRFRNEVQITRRLTHPNIIRTFDFGEAQGRYYYMTMEYIRGVTLEKLIQSQYKGGLTFDECLKILIEILKGISYAHKLGIIHRDLKPANVLISETGEVKLSDFGLARAQAVDKHFTQTGECVGTPFYMAPEQIKEEPTDERSDLYAIGIIAYELIAGYVPFDDESWFNLASKIIKDPLPDLPRKKHVPPWFREMVSKVTSKRKEDRFNSADELQQLLETHMAEELDDTQVQTPLTDAVTEPLPLSRLSSRLRGDDETVKLRIGFTSWYRYAPIMLIASLVALAGIAMVSLGTKSIDTAKTDFRKNTTVISEFTDTLQKLQQVVTDIHQNKGDIDKFLDSRGKEKEAAPTK